MRPVLLSMFARHLSRSFAATALIATTLLAGSSAARAEWVVDAFFGIPFPRGGEIEANEIAAESFPADVDLDVDVTFGLRFGHFARIAPFFDLGGMIDTSGTLGEVGGVDFNFVPISALLMARFPILVSDDHPNGIVQPYLGVGPSAVWSEMRQNVFEDTGMGAGAAGVAGVKVLFYRSFGIFAEYRCNYFSTSHEDAPQPVQDLGRVHIKPVVHTPTIGVSWHFDIPAWRD
ncbi:MAG TPA: hypothetical protein VEB21_16940 [Terriglobales bacterium]|nr:hypothetical protein [Terriglobales bacterium]